MSENSNPPFDVLYKAAEAALQQCRTGWAPQPGAPGADGGQGEPAAKLVSLQADYYQKQLVMWKAFLRGESADLQEGQPAKSDRRFTCAEWSTSPYFDFIRKSYLLSANYLTEMAHSVQLEGKAKERLEFATRQFVDAMSPANFAATNPEVLKLALESKGENFAHGIQNLIDDLSKGRLSTTDESEFEVGRNLGVTSGQVIFENELIQLIQYAPATTQVYKRPLLMVPPCINKFYILDMTPETSLVRFAIEQGHTVFMVSWRNIEAEQGHLVWDDYLRLGLMEGIAAAHAISRADKINVLGFCVGGTLLASVLAVLAAKGDDRVASVTLLATLLDYSDPGELGMFIDEQHVATREASIGSGGVLPGKELSDMVWAYVVNNYLKGKQPAAFDLLYWNADSSSLPGPMYCYYLRNTYLENNLRVPGKLSMLGQKVDLGRIDLPAYILAMREDHIVPWKAAYLSRGLLGGDRRFVLGASGHVAGIVNPPAKNLRSHWIEDTAAGNKRSEQAALDSQAWFDAAKQVPGSWWNDWAQWLAKWGGAKVRAKSQLGNKAYRPIEPAPGRYVRKNIV